MKTIKQYIGWILGGIVGGTFIGMVIYRAFEVNPALGIIVAVIVYGGYFFFFRNCSTITLDIEELTKWMNEEKTHEHRAFNVGIAVSAAWSILFLLMDHSNSITFP